MIDPFLSGDSSNCPFIEPERASKENSLSRPRDFHGALQENDDDDDNDNDDHQPHEQREQDTTCSKS